MAGRISTRISLRWVPDEADEPTDTLVFNVGSYFIDLRVLKKDHSIDWGMAGVRDILSEKPLKCRWNKVIDSLGAAGEADEGAFEPLPNGDSLETGSMPCPEKNNAMTDYEEVWRDVEIRPGSKRAWIIQSLDGKTFLGRIGGSYMAMSQGEGTSFSARREDLESVSGKWNTKYALGEVETVPSIASFDTEGEEGWEIGKTVSLAGKQYIVRASEEI